MIIPIILVSLLTPVFLLGAPWEEHGIKIVESGASAQEGSQRYLLRDAAGRTFEVNYTMYPEPARRSRAIALKDLFSGWKYISPDRMEFYFSSEGIHANIMTKGISWKGENLMPYLPAGLTFNDTTEEILLPLPHCH